MLLEVRVVTNGPWSTMWKRCVWGQKLRNRWEGPGELIVIIKLASHDHSNLCLSPSPANPWRGTPLDPTPELKAFH